MSEQVGSPQKFRSKPVEKWALLWRGGDYQVLNAFCGKNWGRADVVAAGEVWPSDIEDSEQVMVFNIAEQVWLPVPVGWWIIQGVCGEFYPCKPDIFETTYEPVD